MLIPGPQLGFDMYYISMDKSLNPAAPKDVPTALQNVFSFSDLQLVLLAFGRTRSQCATSSTSTVHQPTCWICVVR